MASGMGLTLRQHALEALEKSTKMFEVAIELLKQGNQVEAERVRNQARTQRTLSTLLMVEASNLDLDSKTFGSRQHPEISRHVRH